MEIGPQSEEISRLQDLSDLMSELIYQFKRTKEELSKTSFQIQIELLTGRLTRLKDTILELKLEIDALCVPESSFQISLPYEGAVVEGDTVLDFSWKSVTGLELEEQELLKASNDIVYHEQVERVYNFYKAICSKLYKKEEFHKTR